MEALKWIGRGLRANKSSKSKHAHLPVSPSAPALAPVALPLAPPLAPAVLCDLFKSILTDCYAAGSGGVGLPSSLCEAVVGCMNDG
eukprot:52164-Hanusia_phi.AAC.1